MGDQIKVRFRVEYKGEEDDVDTPHPISVDMQRGSSIVDLLGNAAHFHSDFGFTTRYIKGVGDVVTSLCTILNEGDYRWVFYSPAQHCLPDPIGKCKLTIGQEVVARYEKIEDCRDDQKKQTGIIH